MSNAQTSNMLILLTVEESSRIPGRRIPLKDVWSLHLTSSTWKLSTLLTEEPLLDRLAILAGVQDVDRLGFVLIAKDSSGKAIRAKKVLYCQFKNSGIEANTNEDAVLEWVGGSCFTEDAPVEVSAYNEGAKPCEG